MKRQYEDLSGKQFNRLTVISLDINNKTKNRKWLCRCECKSEKITSVTTTQLKTNRTKSCGCLSKETATKRNTSHSLSKTLLYKLWGRIKSRCYNTKEKSFPDYGGRGIYLCNDWLNSPEVFIKYVSKLKNCLKDEYSLDRIDNNDIYKPGNVRWVSKIEQNRNRRTTKLNKNDVIKIRELVSKITQVEIANIYNISTSHVNSIIYRRTWKDI